MLEKDNFTEANNRLAQLEQGEVAHLFSSYRSAIASVLELVEHNSHIVAYVDKSGAAYHIFENCLLYTSPSPRDRQKSRMPSSA